MSGIRGPASEALAAAEREFKAATYSNTVLCS
jgi:hypothetical protein